MSEGFTVANFRHVAKGAGVKRHPELTPWRHEELAPLLTWI
jgi:hypothetical protein